MMLRALSALARAEDVAVGQLARDAITLDLRLRAKPKRDDRTDAALAALPCALLAKDLAGSTSWRDLHPRVLRCAHGIAAKKLCKASDFGHSHSRIARHFGPAFPGHPHAHLFMMDAQESEVIST